MAFRLKNKCRNRSQDLAYPNVSLVFVLNWKTDAEIILRN